MCYLKFYVIIIRVGFGIGFFGISNADPGIRDRDFLFLARSKNPGNRDLKTFIFSTKILNILKNITKNCGFSRFPDYRDCFEIFCKSPGFF